MKRKMCDDLFSQLDSLSVKPTGANEHTHTHTRTHSDVRVKQCVWRRCSKRSISVRLLTSFERYWWVH